jgi:hypothetical protein
VENDVDRRISTTFIKWLLLVLITCININTFDIAIGDNFWFNLGGIHSQNIVLQFCRNAIHVHIIWQPELPHESSARPFHPVPLVGVLHILFVSFSGYSQTALVYQFDFQFFLLQPCTHIFNRVVSYLIDGLQIEMQGNKNKESWRWRECPVRRESPGIPRRCPTDRIGCYCCGPMDPIGCQLSIDQRKESRPLFQVVPYPTMENQANTENL